jgi:hypothetical protein
MQFGGREVSFKPFFSKQSRARDPTDSVDDKIAKEYAAVAHEAHEPQVCVVRGDQDPGDDE